MSLLSEKWAFQEINPSLRKSNPESNDSFPVLLYGLEDLFLDKSSRHLYRN